MCLLNIIVKKNRIAKQICKQLKNNLFTNHSRRVNILLASKRKLLSLRGVKIS